MDYDLNIISKIIKHVGENIGQNLHDIGFCNDFLYMTKGTGNERKNRQIGLYEN